MKVFSTSLNKNLSTENFSLCGYTTHTFWHNSVVKYGNIEISDIDSCDVVFLFPTYLAGKYEFDHETAHKIAATKKPIVIFDFSEYGGHDETYLYQYNLHGYKIEHNGLLNGEYKYIHEFLCNNLDLVKCFFKREMSSQVDYSVVPFKVYPLEFVSEMYCPDIEPDSFDKYFERPLMISFIWGLSNLSRPYLHAEFMLRMDDFHCQYLWSRKQVENSLQTQTDQKSIFLANIASYERIEHGYMMELFQKSIMVIDLYGCGLKCFRNVESSANTLSAKQDTSKLVWTYPWTEENSISLPCLPKSNIIDHAKSADIILHWWQKRRDTLYPMYLKSIEINRLYHPKNYVPNHVIRHIEENL